jgi:hypothetical protein
MGWPPFTTAIKCGFVEKRRKRLSIDLNSMELNCMDFNRVVMTTLLFLIAWMGRG